MTKTVEKPEVSEKTAAEQTAHQAAETFENARKGLDAVRASQWDYKIVDHLARHGDQEDDLMANYERLAAKSPSEAVRYLSRLVLDDERRHHRILVEMANAVGWGWPGASPEPAVPELSFQRRRDPEFAEAVRALLEAERRDRHDLKKLRRELRPVADTTLWALLVDLLLLDTEKHIRVLEFISDHLV